MAAIWLWCGVCFWLASLYPVQATGQTIVPATRPATPPMGNSNTVCQVRGQIFRLDSLTYKHLTVHLVNIATQAEQQVQPTATGHFIFHNVSVGRYTVYAMGQPFNGADPQEIEVTVNGPTPSVELHEMLPPEPDYRHFGPADRIFIQE